MTTFASKEEYFESSNLDQISRREQQLNENPVHFYAGFGKIQELKDSINSTNIDSRDHNGEGYPALYYAARYNHTDAVNMLLENGANPNIKGYYDWTPLHVAKSLEIAKTLVAHGADVCSPINVSTLDGRTPLTEVLRADGTRYASDEHIEFLIEQSAENGCLPGYLTYSYDEI